MRNTVVDVAAMSQRALGIASRTEATGSGLVQFRAFAAGLERAIAGQFYEFDSTAGYHVRLERAQLTLG